MAQSEKPPVWFWLVGGFALLWNMMGMAVYLWQIFMPVEQFAALPPHQQAAMANAPFWVTAAFAVAVFTGLTAAILFLLRNRRAVRLYLASLIAVAIQFSAYFLVPEYKEFVAKEDWIMPILVTIFAVLFLVVARHAEKKGYLR